MTTKDNDTGYNGNINVPRAGTKLEWTKDMVKEYIKCSEDPVYFLKTYSKIVSVDDGLINFNCYDFQEDILSNYLEHNNILLNQSRQSGKTTVAVGIILHYMLFNPFKRIAILANKGSQATEIMSRLQLAFEYLPKWLKGGVKEWNKNSIVLENDTVVIAASSSSSSIRGKSCSMIFLDEMAFIPQWEEFSASVLPTMSSGKHTRLLIASTPNGLNQFYVYCENAKKGLNNFLYREIPWNMVPGRDEKWKENILATINFDMQKFDAEYNCQFLGSSGTLIAGWKLKQLEVVTPDVHKDNIKLFEQPQENRTYAMICDVSRGKGLDYSAFHVIDITEVPYKQVMTFRCNKTLPMDYAGIIYRIATHYNNAMTMVENNDIGGEVANLLYHEYEYENLLTTESKGTRGKILSAGFSSNVDLGIRTTKTVKSKGCALLKLLIEQNNLIVRESETISELSRFSKKGNSYEAEEGCHDDLVMGLVLFAWMTEQKNFKELTNIDTLKLARERSDEEIESDLIPFGIINNGIDDYEEEEDDKNFWKNFEKQKKKVEELRVPRTIDELFGDRTSITNKEKNEDNFEA